jgi:hypothetical protein
MVRPSDFAVLLRDKANTAQNLDGNRLTGSLLSPQGRNIGDCSFSMQAGAEAKLRFDHNRA